MISGNATQEGTAAHADKYGNLQFNTLGSTRWQVSPAGFGGYRVSAGIEAHYRALVKSLGSGINLIDTSTNYTDGGSEELVGQVLEEMISSGRITRDGIVVVSKVGYLQGHNFELSQERKQQGRPFPDLVPYGKALEHCIHPEFIEDQLSRSLDRLGLETLDLLLLHNPEYYLGWATRRRRDLHEAREIFYQRIRRAFEYLEEEVVRGRIQAYGISSNTFVAPADDQEFVSLDRVWRLAQEVSVDHHFRVIQFPMNLFETGGVMEENQPHHRTLLDVVQSEQLGALINRPLNAFAGDRMIRLAEVEDIGHHTDDDIIQSIGLLNKSEKALWRKLLPALNLPLPLSQRIKDQISVGDQLKHHWRNFGSYERWRQFKDGLLWPHVQGVFDFLQPYADQVEGLEPWLDSHHRKLVAAVRAVGSLYVRGAARQVASIKQRVTDADTSWSADGPLSQLAIRALRSTAGISCVLVGMRQEAYVCDVLDELSQPVAVETHTDAWRRLKASLAEFS